MDKPALAELLGLEPHPEGGWYRQTWRSEVEFEPEGYGGTRASATAIYFLLAPGEESRWHQVRSAEIWLWHSGGPLTLEYGDTPETGEAVTLGPDVRLGQQPQVVIPPDAWQAARPAGDEPVLVSCVVSPGFDFADFRML
ncbi:cupin domain-containing protein [Kribbella capetownensis]|uniref:Cupin domain-containing protein n=1 Tax=Kribbella capetownensis TaxID=1572659 RepID=A0A4R0ILV8_9ACTN|nr:cupin domain-containing protein [Kribbella capetownensis]TCC34551.1 cupin domain-containing protein [Kribbella capetownensis]